MYLIINFPIQARALYDFDAQPGTGELSIKEGEILAVLRQDVGEGWWEGTNSQGQTGLFPAAYVEVSPNVIWSLMHLCIVGTVKIFCLAFESGLRGPSWGIDHLSILISSSKKKSVGDNSFILFT